jgi:hypothetical protein
MKLPNPPEEVQEPKPDELPDANEQPKPKPRFSLFQGASANPSAKKGKKPASMVGGQSVFRAGNTSQAMADTSPKPDQPTHFPPEPGLPVESAPPAQIQNSNPVVPANPEKEMNPGRRLHHFEAAAKNTPPARIPWKLRIHTSRETTHRAYWDVATTFSLIVNAVLVGILIVMALQIRNLKTTVNNLLGGLYGNFVKMDQASINTTITVNAQIPLDFTLPVSQNTQVVLTGNVVIPNAHVVINTGGLNINSLASVTLPAGTSLPIALNLAIPVQSTIPVSLQVPVNIPMSQTELHQPFTGLQTTLLPLYCTFNKNAQYPDGTYICAEHDTATPGTP